MNEKLMHYKNKLLDYWKTKTKKQKMIIAGSAVSVIVLLILGSIFAAKPNLVPLYKDLSPQETGQIKETLDSRGIKSEIADGGTTIKVPEELVDTLKVELAAEGIPNSGEIYFSSFGEGGFGITQEEFEMRKVAAIQNELKRLIKRFEGVQDADVMVSMPQQSVFVGEEQGTASASIVIYQKPGYKFKDEQIEGLYHLVSKSVANLPLENIYITNQYAEPLNRKDFIASSSGINFSDQYEIKKQIERDIQQQVQQMLSLMMGRDKAIVTVTADVDTSKVNTTSNIVKPIDEENMRGIAISAEKITESFVGDGQTPGGEVGTGDGIPGYPGEDGNQNGQYENIEERINYDVTRIMETVESSPYKVKDLGIQVAIDSTDLDEQTMQTLNDEIKNMLNGIIQTTIDNKEANLDGKVNVTWQKFSGIKPLPAPTFMDLIRSYIVYVIVGILLLIALIVLLFIVFLKKRKKVEFDEELESITEERVMAIPDINEEHETESTARRKQLEKLAKEKPDEFAKLLRTWLAED
ncbi:flagellar basal-body MS-ring/collar protein FliF [Calidifontibacillus erzurumensis]|uniref:Flagellar M-ring protein n=1 Tax=Calidifontibacillus erzurumensis TaxID=2741433 RepID=A0A8J8KB17_9BACI|nr:flagellar basal-body MS-ring/collar protein FliF [Calidifontibacillus erzurumensis]NSL51187.1 flagellar M-ring protein FliF [Calidifontibacillus erzurumensis]